MSYVYNYTMSFERLAKALERIAKALEDQNKLATPDTTTKKPNWDGGWWQQ